MALMVKRQSTFDEVVLKSGKSHVAINQTLHGRGKLAKIVVTIDSMAGASTILAKRAVVLELDVRELGVLDIPRIELFALGVSSDEPAHAHCQRLNERKLFLSIHQSSPSFPVGDTCQNNTPLGDSISTSEVCVL